MLNSSQTFRKYFCPPLGELCTAFLRGSLVLEAYNVPLNVVVFSYHFCFTFGVDLYLNALNGERAVERKTDRIVPTIFLVLTIMKLKNSENSDS